MPGKALDRPDANRPLGARAAAGARSQTARASGKQLRRSLALVVLGVISAYLAHSAGAGPRRSRRRPGRPRRRHRSRCTRRGRCRASRPSRSRARPGSGGCSPPDIPRRTSCPWSYARLGDDVGHSRLSPGSTLRCRAGIRTRQAREDILGMMFPMLLLTGATGSIGSRLLPLLLERGEDVRCLVREPRRLGGAPGRRADRARRPR